MSHIIRDDLRLVLCICPCPVSSKRAASAPAPESTLGVGDKLLELDDAMVAKRVDSNNGGPVRSQALKELQWLSLFCAFSHPMIKTTLEFSSWQLPPFQPHRSPTSGGGVAGSGGGNAVHKR